MGGCITGCIDKCCWGTFGARCCNIISIVGFIYFGLNFLIFPVQKKFYEFHMENPDNTRISMLVCSILYLIFFIITFFRIRHLNKLKQIQRKKNEQIQQSRRSAIQPSAINRSQHEKHIMLQHE